LVLFIKKKNKGLRGQERGKPCAQRPEKLYPSFYRQE
jgi:hypothetical protein